MFAKNAELVPMIVNWLKVEVGSKGNYRRAPGGFLDSLILPQILPPFWAPLDLCLTILGIGVASFSA